MSEKYFMSYLILLLPMLICSTKLDMEKWINEETNIRSDDNYQLKETPQGTQNLTSSCKDNMASSCNRSHCLDCINYSYIGIDGVCKQTKQICAKNPGNNICGHLTTTNCNDNFCQTCKSTRSIANGICQNERILCKSTCKNQACTFFNKTVFCEPNKLEVGICENEFCFACLKVYRSLDQICFLVATDCSAKPIKDVCKNITWTDCSVTPCQNCSMSRIIVNGQCLNKTICNPNDYQQDIPQGTASNIPQDTTKNIPPAISQGSSNHTPQDIKQGTTSSVPQGTPNDKSNNIPQNIQQNQATCSQDNCDDEDDGDEDDFYFTYSEFLRH